MNRLAELIRKNLKSQPEDGTLLELPEDGEADRGLEIHGAAGMECLWAAAPSAADSQIVRQRFFIEKLCDTVGLGFVAPGGLDQY